jgi:signal transduction histidine kinase
VHPAGATGITSAFFDDRLLREARELFDRVFNDSSDAFLVSRLDDRRIIEVNDAFVQLTGIPRDVAVSMPDGRLGLRIPEAVLREAGDELRTVGAVDDWPVTLTAADGTEREVRASAHLVTVGGERCALTMLTDVTALLESDRRRRAALAELVGAEEAERARIAVDLHDDTVQVLAAVGMQLEAVERRLDTLGETRYSAMVRDAGAELAAAGDRARRLMFHLRPTTLDREGLQPALDALAGAIADDAGIELAVDVAARRYPPLVERLAWRTVREALVNVRHHADATHGSVQLEERDGALVGTVADDGCGFDAAVLAAKAADGHIGIDAMRERVETYGGALSIESARGAGTVVRFRLPLDGT